MKDVYRPSGPLDWILSRLQSIVQWDVVCAVAAEERSLSVPRYLSSVGGARHVRAVFVKDPASRYGPAIEKACKQNSDDMKATFGRSFSSYECKLFSEVDELYMLCEFLISNDCENVVLDISALPKRFFFFIVRHICELASIRNLVVTYTIPESYGDVMHLDPGSWMPLPGFGSLSSNDDEVLLMISVGFSHLKLMELIQDRKPNRVKLLLPFPSIPPGFARNWEFIRFMHEQAEFKEADIRRVHPLGVSLAFDQLCGMVKGHNGEVICAPFGPKPISLAMALFSIACGRINRDVTVGYTQPTIYTDSYSNGVRKDPHGSESIQAYCVKLDGRNIYGLPSE